MFGNLSRKYTQSRIAGSCAGLIINFSRWCQVAMQVAEPMCENFYQQGMRISIPSHCHWSFYYWFYFKKRFYLFTFRERGRERERQGEKHHWLVASYTPPTGGLACKPVMCPDLELNQQPFSLWDNAQPTEPHQPRLILLFKSALLRYDLHTIKFVKYNVQFNEF